MKPSRFVWMFWCGNLVLLAAGAVLMWQEGRGAQAERSSRNAAIANLEIPEPRIQWKPDTVKPTIAVVDTRLSPIERPREPEPSKPVIVKLPQPEKTDDQLRIELERALNKQFKLLRMMLSSTDDYPDIALVVADTARLQWFEGMNLKEEYAKAPSTPLKKLAWDLVVITIDHQGVLVDAASQEKPEKRFEILLKIYEEPLSPSMLNASFLSDGEAIKLESEASAPALENAWDWGYPIPEHDSPIDDLAKHVKATDYGLEILPDLPDDNVLRKHGAQGGDIIKSINGESVKSMSDVRRVVREQYNAGTREFKVGFERDGVPGESTFKAPAKK